MTYTKDAAAARAWPVAGRQRPHAPAEPAPCGLRWKLKTARGNVGEAESASPGPLMAKPSSTHHSWYRAAVTGCVSTDLKKGGAS